MQRKITGIIIAVFVCALLLLVGCGDQKSPDSGYLSAEEVDQCIQNLKTKEVTSYGYDGSLNYFEFNDSIVPRTISKSNQKFEDSSEYYQLSCSSYYLRVPLHINKVNWYSDKQDSSNNSLSTKAQLEGKIYRPDSLDQVYYYHRDGGGFIIKTFGVNKGLIIFQKDSITCRGKWNITIEYDEYGYLVSEKFETINSSEKNKKDCCYGSASYRFIG